MENNKEELIALITYLINHNDHHNDELKDLALSLKDVDLAAYSKVEEAISLFKKGNENLRLALEKLNK